MVIYTPSQVFHKLVSTEEDTTILFEEKKFKIFQIIPFLTDSFLRNFIQVIKKPYHKKN